MTMKIFRKDLLIENLRKGLYHYSCSLCPIKDVCKYDQLLCSDEKAEEFNRAIIDKFSTEVEVVEDD